MKLFTASELRRIANLLEKPAPRIGHVRTPEIIRDGGCLASDAESLLSDLGVPVVHVEHICSPELQFHAAYVVRGVVFNINARDGWSRPFEGLLLADLAALLIWVEHLGFNTAPQELARAVVAGIKPGQYYVSQAERQCLEYEKEDYLKPIILTAPPDGEQKFSSGITANGRPWSIRTGAHEVVLHVESLERPSRKGWNSDISVPVSVSTSSFDPARFRVGAKTMKDAPEPEENLEDYSIFD